ncbi:MULTISPECIES: ribonuclease III [Dellaglioa]|uniref:Ribonuclease 3 n=2 Tax=Dellaglioa algida TaxID=105612 RepID=A0A0R1HPV0_9LACO|nr:MULTISPECIES: ribonuclease III [Dellaglioa]KRK46515.1 ribonuclease III [Dellaglioa algida DSM 15638]MCZ2492667.1 ribonuclease III [Dellaglioa carnosa]MDK1716778.1 ribonuclease III [Dellaglioa algida]MDK1718600.1 ribonuclease III [Dellaglioa algida]MDK1720557.1 ribonuclease III [Dellaglioa algida]
MIKGLNEMLEEDFGIKFTNVALLDEAFTQASYVNEHPKENLKFYERIEFLGDAVLQLTVSEYLYQRYTMLPQGKLTRLRAAMVCEESFSAFAKECRFDEFIRLGKGEEKANARQRPALLCDIFESFVGALYQDQGKLAVETFIRKVIFPKLDLGWFDHVMDYKTSLQEFLQKDGDIVITYDVVDDLGPEHDRQYVMTVSADGKIIGQGAGHSKKVAEQQAASNALGLLRK